VNFSARQPSVVGAVNCAQFLRLSDRSSRAHRAEDYPEVLAGAAGGSNRAHPTPARSPRAGQTGGGAGVSDNDRDDRPTPSHVGNESLRPWDLHTKDRAATPVGCLAAHGARDSPDARAFIYPLSSGRAPPCATRREVCPGLSALGGRGGEGREGGTPRRGVPAGLLFAAPAPRERPGPATPRSQGARAQAIGAIKEAAATAGVGGVMPVLRPPITGMRPRLATAPSTTDSSIFKTPGRVA